MRSRRKTAGTRKRYDASERRALRVRRNRELAPLLVCPALKVWLGVAEVTEKSGTTVSGNNNVWLGCPAESATARLML